MKSIRSLIAIATLAASLVGVVKADTFPAGTENIAEKIKHTDTYQHVWNDVKIESATANVDVGTNIAGTWMEFLGSATTNLIIVPYGLTSTDFKNFGGGLAVGYELSQNVVPFMRLEADKHGFYSPSGTVQLQVPIKFGGLTIVPLAYTGVAIPLGKHSSDPVIGLVGTGAALRLGAKFDLLAAYELRSSSENHVLIGLGWKPNGW